MLALNTCYDGIHTDLGRFCELNWVYAMALKCQIPIVYCWYGIQWTFVLRFLMQSFAWKCICVFSLLSSTIILNSSIQGCYSWKIHSSFGTLSFYTAPSDIARGRQFIGCLQDCRETHLSHLSLVLLYKVWSLVNQAIEAAYYFYSWALRDNALHSLL